MKKLTLILLLVVASLMAWAGPALTAKQAFERLKTLEGTWEGKASGDMDVKVVYKVTGAGSALIETQFPGTGHEMVTVYHLDGDQLVLTHYCAAGNQPSMKLKSSDANTLSFDFTKGSNMKPTDMHMHSMKLSFKAADHVVSDWTSFQNGKAGYVAHFDLKRVK